MTKQRGTSLCPNCTHLDSTGARACTLCCTAIRHFARAEEALLRHALGRSIEVCMLNYAKLPPPDGVAAQLPLWPDTTLRSARKLKRLIIADALDA